MENKIYSIKKNKTNYFYTIFGITLVLIFLSLMGWIFMNINSIGKSLKEDIRISVYLKTKNLDTISYMQEYIGKQPYSKDVIYINAEEAKRIWNSENNEDWSKILDYNPLPESIDFYAKGGYINADSLQIISKQLSNLFYNNITDIQFPQSLVSTLNEKITKIGFIFLIITIVLIAIVIVSIDNTIKLSMYSNRFLIKTMQMVGATSSYIAKPFLRKAIINGFISSIIASFMFVIIIQWTSNIIPQLNTSSTKMNLIIISVIILIGISISYLSTYRIVLKYLKKKLDDLY